MANDNATIDGVLATDLSAEDHDGVDAKHSAPNVEPSPTTLDLATLRRMIKVGGYVRATLGVFLLVAPGLASMWLGPDARRPAVKALVRIAAIRDLILGAGSIVAANEGTHLRRWVEFTMIADGVDAIASAAAIRHTPPLRGAMMTLTAAGAAAGGALILSQLPEEVPSTA